MNDHTIKMKNTTWWW